MKQLLLGALTMGMLAGCGFNHTTAVLPTAQDASLNAQSMSATDINQFSQKIMRRFDRNGDGTITLQGDSMAVNLRDVSEVVAVKREIKRDRNGIVNYIYAHDNQAYVIPYFKQTVSSYDTFFKAADRDKDSKVNSSEILALLTTYDRNANGKLDGGFLTSELSSLAKDFPEKTNTVWGLLSYTRDQDGKPNIVYPTGGDDSERLKDGSLYR